MKVNPKLLQVSSDTFINDYLSACGVKDIDKYLRPDNSCFDSPWDYPNMEEAVELFNTAIQEKCVIGILVDSDLDGCASAALMTMFLRGLLRQRRIEPIIFQHTGKQHGLNDVLDDIINSPVDLLIIPDAGSNDRAECMALAQNHIRTIILDHHEILNSNPYAIVVNHHLGDGLNTALSGTGVTDKFVRAYCEKYGCSRWFFDDLVAISLISDVCDITTLENRTYLYSGLNNVTNPFLQLLFEKNSKKYGYTPEAIAWGIAPLANALARVDNQETKLLFFKALIGDIDGNEVLTDLRRIKRQQDEAVKLATNTIEPKLNLDHKVIIGFGEVEDKNYLGLIANKFAGKYNKPTILLRESNNTTWSGSLRSPVELADRINTSKLAKAMGHQSACGIFIKKSNLNKLLDWFDKQDLSQKPVKTVTAEINPNNIDIPLCKACQDNMMLWSGSDGGKIPQPKFYVKLDITPDDVTVFAKKTNTVKVVKDGVSFIKFSVPQSIVDDLKNRDNILEMIVSLEVNEWNGNFTPQANIEEWEITPKDKKEEFIDNSEFDWDEVFK